MKIFSNQKLRTSLKSPKATRRAFTLVEMIVALGIFSVVAVVALGALVKIISANKKAQTLQASITNLNFALDAMSRDMSVGTNYHLDTVDFTGKTLSSPVAKDIYSGTNNINDTFLAFTSSKADPILTNDCNLIYVYSFHYISPNNYDLQKKQQTDCVAPSYGSFDSILDPSVTITGYYVKVNYDAGTNPYPLATIRISGYAGVREKEKTYFDVQTSVSSRFKGGL